MTQEEIQELKDTIKEKHGSYSSFCRAAKIDRYEFQRDFLQKEYPDSKLLAKIDSMVDRVKAKPSRPVLTASKLKALKAAVMRSDGVVAFCAANPQFKKETVYQILVGRYPTITDTVRGLLDHFGL